MLTVVPELKIDKPVYLEKDFELDDVWIEQLKLSLVDQGNPDASGFP